jgi:hypothetical protein
MNRELFDDMPPGQPAEAASDGSDDAHPGGNDDIPYFQFPPLIVEQNEAEKSSRKEKRKESTNQRKLTEVDFLSTPKNLTGRALFEHRKKGKLLESLTYNHNCTNWHIIISVTLKLVWVQFMQFVSVVA